MIIIVYNFNNNENEFLVPLFNYLKELNYDCSIQYSNNILNENTNLYIGIFHSTINMPKNYIYFNIEPEENINDSMMYRMQNAKAVLSYYIPNRVLNINTIYFPFPYHKSIENLYNVKFTFYKYDVLFYGCINEKRKNILDLIKKNSINLYCPNLINAKNIYKNERDELIFSSKIILLQNYYKNDIDLPRITYLISNKKFFIYYIHEDEEDFLKNKFDNLIIKCNKNNIINIINYYLTNENTSLEKINELYNYFIKTYNINKYISNEIINCFTPLDFSNADL